MATEWIVVPRNQLTDSTTSKKRIIGDVADVNVRTPWVNVIAVKRGKYYYLVSTRHMIFHSRSVKLARSAAKRAGLGYVAVKSVR